MIDLTLVKDLEETKNRERLLQDKSNGLRVTNQKREERIRALFDVYAEYSEERKAKCAKFETESNGRLRLVLHESTNVDEFKAKLKTLKKGSYLRDVEIDQLCEKMTPHEFILEILRFQVSRDPKKFQAFAERAGVDEQRMRSLCEFLLAEVKYEDLLSLQYRAHPQDRPEIRFKVWEDKYELIREVSVGQKCTAMLIMALSDGAFPIVIDQPEDSLDFRSVWDDMCVKIRKGKESRQFIFTTHNSCLAVASDTDKYIIVESDARKGKVIASGALETTGVKADVINYLEGGRTTYEAKATKYGPYLNEEPKHSEAN